MKNIHILQTDQPTSIFETNIGLQFSIINKVRHGEFKGYHIYITSDEEIKDGDWMIRGNEQPTLVTPNFFWDFGVRYYKIILTTDPTLIADGVQEIDDDFLGWFVKNPSYESVEVEKDQYIDKTISDTEVFTDYIIIIPKEEPKQIYYNTVGRENGKFVIKGQFNTQKEALDLANELNKKFPDLYYDWNETLIKEEPKQETLEEAAKKYANKKGDIPTTELEDAIFKQGFIDGANWQQERMYSEEEVKFIISEALQSALVKVDLEQWFNQFHKKK